MITHDPLAGNDRVSRPLSSIYFGRVIGRGERGGIAKRAIRAIGSVVAATASFAAAIAAIVVPGAAVVVPGAAVVVPCAAVVVPCAGASLMRRSGCVVAMITGSFNARRQRAA